MRHSIAVAIALLILATVATAISSDLLVHWLWFESLGFATVFQTLLAARWTAFALGFGLALVWLYANWWAADRGAPKGFDLPWDEDVVPISAHVRRLTPRSLRGPAAVVATGAALLAGTGAYGNWEVWLRGLYGVSLGRTDPVFGRDLSFYLFRMPVEEALQSGALALTVLALIGVVVIYGLRGGLQLHTRGLALADAARLHVGLLVALLFLLWAWSYRLDAMRLLYSADGAVFGATYTDIHVNLPVLRLLLWIAVAAAAGSVFAALSGRLMLPVIGAALLFVGSIVGRGVVPGLYQQYVVLPNELAREEPYIRDHIELTRLAYGLTDVTVRSFDPTESVTWSEVQADPGTLANTRLWDTRPLLTAYRQLQQFRVYYEFNSVDVDRYALGDAPNPIAGAEGVLRRDDATQVMLAGRELNVDLLPSQAQTWQNRWLVYTHGYGVAATPVAGVEPNGMPSLIVRDIPPASSGGPVVERPAIYFGELTTNPVIVGTTETEFDYPRGTEAVETRYVGADGVGVGTWARQLLFSWYFGEWSILLSDYLTEDSRLLFHRTVQERISRLAPFLHLDRDPYLAVVDGGLVWIQDAYTISDRFPYSLPSGALLRESRTGAAAARRGPVGASFNYVRNSVKVTLDAYDGTVRFYAFDEDDPVLATYRRIFPDMFLPASEMPESTRAHVRYPADLFRIQTEIFNTYHMTEPRLFYNREDVWTAPTEMYAGSSIPMDPYFVLTVLPESTAPDVQGEPRGGGAAETAPGLEPEFLLMLPLTPANRENLIAWMAARSDPEHYGQLVVYEFPKDRLIYGPMQIEARIDQDPIISQQLSLWDQRGSQVIRGNLLVIPVGKGILYIEPVFLRSAQSDLPELRRVIIANGQSVVMEPRLVDALAASLPDAPAGLAAGRAADPDEPRAAAPAAAPGQPPVLTRATELSRRALEAYERAQERLRAGDWAGYGEAMEELRRRLDELAGAQGPGEEREP